MNEPLLERIEQLERSVKRWKRVSLVLAFLLILAVIGGVLAAIPPTHERSNLWLLLPWVRARHEAEALRALQAEEAAIRAAEAAKRAEDDAAKKKQP